MIKANALKVKSSWIIWEGPKSKDKCPYKRRTKDGRAEGSVKAEVGTGVTLPQAKESLQPQKQEEAGRALLEPQGEVWVC